VLEILCEHSLGRESGASVHATSKRIGDNLGLASIGINWLVNHQTSR
jgi:hypothetical protein